MEGYFGSGLRAHLPRDDTCTVLAEFGNEYTDNGFDRFIQREKRRLYRESQEYPIWRGGTAVARKSLSLAAPYRPILETLGAQAVSLPSAPASARLRPSSNHIVSMLLHQQKQLSVADEHGSDAEITEQVKQARIEDAAANYRRAQSTRELFNRQRDRSAHARDLEFIDKRGVQYLPDGTRVRQDVASRSTSGKRRLTLGNLANNQREEQRHGDDDEDSILHRVGSIRSLNKKIPQQALSTDDKALLKDFFAPPTQNLTAARYQAHGSGGANSGHARRSRGEGYYCNTADDLGCPVDASVGTVGVFRQVRRWRQHVPTGVSNFSSKAFDWPLRLQLPLQDEARSFERLMGTQMEEQQRRLQEEAEEIENAIYRMEHDGSSARSTPAFFSGDGDGADCLIPPGESKHSYQRHQSHHYQHQAPLPRMRDDRVEPTMTGAGGSLSARRLSEPPFSSMPHDAIASPMITLSNRRANASLEQQQQTQRNVGAPRPPPPAAAAAGSSAPQSARPISARTAAALSSVPSMRFSLNQQQQQPTRSLRKRNRAREHIHGEGWSDKDDDEQEEMELDLKDNAIKNSIMVRSLRPKSALHAPRSFPQPPQFRAVNADPRFTKPQVLTVGQRMIMADTQLIPQRTSSSSSSRAVRK